MNIQAEIQALKERIINLEAMTGTKPSPATDRRKLPVNHAAYERALDARIRGDRKAMKEYCKFYRIPT